MAETSEIDVSVAVFVHDQDHRMHGCITSVLRAVSFATERGLAVELLLILQDPSPQSLAWVDRYIGPPWKVVRPIDLRLGIARQEAFRASRGRFFAMIDGWDLWSATWISDAVDAATKRPYPTVWHPEAVIRFGNNLFTDQGYGLLFQPDAVAFEYDYASMLSSNPYPTGSFAPRSVLDAVAFPVEDSIRGWTAVDWWWNCNVVGSGIHHRVVLETFHYQRVDAAGVPFSAEKLAVGGRIGPTPLTRGRLQSGP